jgi:hypothetical protein
VLGTAGGRHSASIFWGEQRKADQSVLKRVPFSFGSSVVEKEKVVAPMAGASRYAGTPDPQNPHHPPNPVETSVIDA